MIDYKTWWVYQNELCEDRGDDPDELMIEVVTVRHLVELKQKLEEADVLLGPWGGSAAGTTSAIQNLIGEYEANHKELGFLWDFLRVLGKEHEARRRIINPEEDIENIREERDEWKSIAQAHMQQLEESQKELVRLQTRLNNL